MRRIGSCTTSTEGTCESRTKSSPKRSRLLPEVEEALVSGSRLKFTPF